MLDRFTLGAVQVLFCARAQASEVGATTIEPEHLLLGLLDEHQGLASRILARAVDGQSLRADIVRRLTGRERVPDSEELPFSAACKRAREYAFEEADRVLRKAVGTEHLLLGFLRDKQSGRGARGKRADGGSGP
jgi:ATP-dependent Clp protease ATP-binding subunit ClpA